MIKYQFILIVIFIFATTLLSCQDLKFVPDENLRAYFKKSGFLTSDSLDLDKIQGRMILEIKDENVSNLDGLQFFSKLWRLDVSNNKILSLNHLPPNLRELFCDNNLISNISNLPEGIEKLSCSKNQIVEIPSDLPRSLTYLKITHNKIKNIGVLPESLAFLDCSSNEIEWLSSLPTSLFHLRISDNLLEEIPCFYYEQLKFLNYYRNPVESITCTEINSYSCSDYWQNCIPTQYFDQPILGNETLLIPSLIHKIDVTIESDYSWGFGSSMEQISYFMDLRPPRKNFNLSRVNMQREYGSNRSGFDVSSSNYTYVIPIDTIMNELRYIEENANLIELVGTDTIISFNFMNVVHGTTGGMSCMDCTSNKIKIELVSSENEKTKLVYEFYNADNITYWCGDKLKNVTRAKDWLFFYRLMSIMFEETHWLREDVFSFENAQLLHRFILDE